MKMLTHLPIAVIIPLLLVGCLLVDGPTTDRLARDGAAADNRQLSGAMALTVERGTVLGQLLLAPQ